MGLLRQSHEKFSSVISVEQLYEAGIAGLDIVSIKYKCFTDCYRTILLGDPEITTDLYCNFAYLYWEGCVFAVYICGNLWTTQYMSTK